MISMSTHVANAFRRLMPVLCIRPTSAVGVCKKDVVLHDISTLLSSERPAHINESNQHTKSSVKWHMHSQPG